MGQRILRIVLIIALLSVPVAVYLAASQDVTGRGPDAVGLIDITGTIGEASPSLWDADAIAHPREINRQLREAADTPRVRAIVLRINSPGGSPAASQEIHRAVMQVRETGKPVVVSMGDSAASGGYYIAVAADHIMANAASLTGSISVRSQVYNVEELMDRWGIRVDILTSGEFKALGSPFLPLQDPERDILQALIDDSHDQFVTAISEGRGLSRAEVEQLADGRVVTGRQAMELGLVDELGSLDDAIELAGGLAGMEGRPPVIEFRQPRTTLERFLGLHALGLLELIQRATAVVGPEDVPLRLLPSGDWAFSIHW